MPKAFYKFVDIDSLSGPIVVQTNPRTMVQVSLWGETYVLPASVARELGNALCLAALVAEQEPNVLDDLDDAELAKRGYRRVTQSTGLRMYVKAS